jgi:glucose-1-phosphate cytidylyltransferase
MNIFILCGGYGTRLDHESKLIAKPMVRIGKEPILYHLIENFAVQGFNNFSLCLGYKSETIINYFLKEKKNFVRINLKNKKFISLKFKNKKIEANIQLMNTGLNSGTGGRIKMIYKYLNLKEDILMTYGDGLSSIPIKKLVNFHKKNNSLLTISAVRPKQRYGILKIKNDKVDYFDNSNKKSNIYINGGFHIVSREAVNKIKNDNTYWEKEPMNYFVKKKKLFAFKYDGFWKSLDTLKDKKDFNQMYNQNKCYWKFKK